MTASPTWSPAPPKATPTSRSSTAWASSTGPSNPPTPPPTRPASFSATGTGFTVGACVATADVDRDAFAEVITGATRGNPHVKIIRGTALASGAASGAVSEPGNNTLEPFLMGQFFAYGRGFDV